MTDPFGPPPPLRRELHYGERVVRCFAERPQHVDAMLKRALARGAQREALACGDRRVSYGALDRAVEHVAGNLARHEFQKGERLGLLLENGVEFVFAALAAARLGVVAVPLNTRQRRPETEYMLNQCQAAGLIYSAGLETELPCAVPSLRKMFAVGDSPQGLPFAGLLEPAGAPPVEVTEEDLFCLLYTSGTTGRPKGAKLTHLGVVHSAMHYQFCLALQSEDAAILAVPASHVTGLVAIVLAMICAGGRSVIMPAFKTRSFLELAVRERMSYTVVVPAIYNLCLLDPELGSFDLSAWRVGGFGGAPMPGATIERLKTTLPGLDLHNIYGSTETTSPATIQPRGAVERRPDSVGAALPCVDIAVMDDAGVEARPGEQGELWIGGATVSPGYWDDPAATTSAFSGGFWKSGDIGSIDSDGFVRVFDRKKDVINRGGFKIYSNEVESVLSHHPDVIECAVVGRPDPVLGERASAFVVARDGRADPESLRQYCAAGLSDYKVPDAFSIQAEPLPRNANGKLLKAALRRSFG